MQGVLCWDLLQNQQVLLPKYRITNTFHSCLFHSEVSIPWEYSYIKYWLSVTADVKICQENKTDTRELKQVFWHQCRKHHSLHTESNRKNWKIMCHFLLTSLLLSGSFNHWTKQAGLGLENNKEIHLPRVSNAFQTLSQTGGWRRNWGHSPDRRKTESIQMPVPAPSPSTRRLW